MSKFMVAVGAVAFALATPALAGPGGEHDDEGQQGDEGHSHFHGGGHGDDGEDSHFEGRGYRSGDGDEEGGRVFIVQRGRERSYYGPAFSTRDYAYRREQQRYPMNFGAPLQQGYADAYLPGLYRSWYPDNDRQYYRYGDGYAYQINRADNRISGLFPLVGGNYLAPGEPYPSAYNFYNVPQPYQRYYPDNGPYNYRYGDGAIYQVNRSNGIVESIVALLTGGGLGGGRGGLGSLLGGLGGLGSGSAKLMTMSGEPLTATKNGGKILVSDAVGNKAVITNADAKRSNGVVHQIDTLLSPKN